MEFDKWDIQHLDDIFDEFLTIEKIREFNTMFSYSKDLGKLTIPESFEEKVYGYLKGEGETKEQTLTRARNQTIVRTFNHYTGEQALFNEIRTSRPGSSKLGTDEKSRKKILEEIDAEHEKLRAAGKCDFCEPEKYTSIDLEKRLSFPTCISGADLTKLDSENGLVILKEPNSLRISYKALSDCIDLFQKWFEKKHEEDKTLIYPFLGWNSHYKSGASQLHAHMRLLTTRCRAYQEVEKLRLASEMYKKDTGENYFKDFFEIHQSLGLGFECTPRAKIVVSLVPKKDKDTWVISNSLGDLKEASYRTISFFINQLGVYAFNYAIQMPPISDDGRVWEDFPYIARFLDRGLPSKEGKTDIGVMEMFGTPVSGSDPFKIARALRRDIKSSLGY